MAQQRKIHYRACQSAGADVYTDFPFSGCHREIKKNEKTEKTGNKVAENSTDRAFCVKPEGFCGIICNSKNEPSDKGAKSSDELR